MYSYDFQLSYTNELRLNLVLRTGINVDELNGTATTSLSSIVLKRSAVGPLEAIAYYRIGKLDAPLRKLVTSVQW